MSAQFFFRKVPSLEAVLAERRLQKGDSPREHEQDAGRQEFHQCLHPPLVWYASVRRHVPPGTPLLSIHLAQDSGK